jgi:acetyl-CoA synthetase
MSVFDLSVADLAACGLPDSDANAFVDALSRLDPQSTAAEHWTWITQQLLRPEQPLDVHLAIWNATFSDWDPASGPPPAWIPEPPDASNIGWLMQHVSVGDFADLYRWSVSQRSEFWAAMVERLGIRLRQPYQNILDLTDGAERPRWLAGAKLNIVDSCFQAPDDSPAIICGTEDQRRRTVSVGQLRSLAARVAHGLADLGLTPGDRVAIDMPMTPECVAIYLGALSAGCPAVTVADSFAPPEIAVRLRIGEVRCVFTQDFIRRGGKRLPLYERVRDAGAPLAIVLPCSDRVDVALRPDDIHWQEFLSDRTELSTTVCDASDETTILFSSGTTGAPKAIPWNHTTPLKAAVDAHLHHDIHHSDVLCWPTNMGWMMGPWLVFAALLNRATIALFDGAPTGRSFGQFVQDAKVTMLGAVPSLISTWRVSDCLAGLDWSHIRAFSSTGECSNPQDMFFLMSRAGYRPIIEYCGGTEIGGGYIAGTVVQPAAPSTFTTPTLGTEMVLLDEDGRETDRGEIFLIPPTIGLSQTLLNGDHHEVYYADTPAWPHGSPLRRHGDELQRFANGSYRAHGRTDDAMNLGGIKVSSRQIEEAVNGVAEIVETAAIAVAPPEGGPDRLVLYVVPANDQSTDTEFRTTCQQELRKNLNPLFKVHDVVLTDSLPRTASNKVMRRTLRQQYDERAEKR